MEPTTAIATPPSTPATPAPALAPAPAAKTAAAATPDPAKEAPVGIFDDINKEIDAAAGIKPDTDNTPPDKTTTTDKPAEPPAKTDEVPPAKLANKQLREAHDMLLGKLKALEAEHAKLKEERAKPTPDPAVLEKLASAEKRAEENAKQAQELENIIQREHYPQSKEYQEQYQKPFDDALQLATSMTTGLEVIANADTGETRDSTYSDFSKVLNAPTNSEARKIARTIYAEADDRATVMVQRGEVLKAWQRAEKAKADYIATFAERQKQEQAAREVQVKQANEFFTKATAEHASRFGVLFQPKEGDTEANEALEKGGNFARQVFDPAGRAKIAPNELIARDAEAFNRIAAWDRLQLFGTRLAKRLKAAETELAELKKGAPGVGEPPRGETPREETLEEEIERVAKHPPVQR